jgi:ribosome maturation factor RimP
MAQNAVHEAGMALYDMEYVPQKKFLRLYIINQETKTAVIEECVKVDHFMTPLLEDLNGIPEGITLEVSSPGLYRDLKNRQHFEWSTGMRVKVYLQTTTSLLNAKGKKITEIHGVLKEVVDDANGFALGILPEKEKKLVYVTSNDIRKALTDPKI